MENEVDYYGLAVGEFGVAFVEAYCSYVECGAEVEEFGLEDYEDCARVFAGGEV
jgi:hypothetical protein